MTTPNLIRIPRRKPLAANIGVFGVGHHTYWPQFEGLLDELHDKLNVFVDKVRAHDVTVREFGIVDDAKSAYALRDRLQREDLDLIFCDMVTYATSATFGIILRDLNVPIVLVALQPRKALDYTRASTHMQLANDDFCSVPEFSGVAIRMGKQPPPVILGTLHDDPAADAEIAEWIAIARVLHDLKSARVGRLGHVLENMLDMQTDSTALTAAFGCHIVETEAGDLMRQFRTVTDADVAAKQREILDLFHTPDPKSDPITRKLTPEDLAIAARAAVALDRFVDEHELDGLAYYYEAEPGSELRQLVTNLTVGNSLLTAAGFPMCGECDLKTCVAMLIEDRLDIGGSFAEFHPIDFNEDFVLVGHDGPHHINIASGQPALRSLMKYHGKPGSGASVEFNIREGAITMLSIGVTAAGRFKLVIAEGQSVAGPIPPTGNTNTRGVFRPDVRTFLKRWVAEGPTHHFALGIGRHARTIEKIANVLSLESAVVAEEPAPGMKTIRGFRWYIAGLLFGASALNFFDRQVLSVLSPEILADLGMSNIDYSHAVSAFTLAYSAMYTLGGRIMDRLGTRRGLGITVAFWTVASLLHAAVRNSLQLTGARFLLGIGEGGCFPGAAKGIFEWFPARQRALAMGIATTGGSAIGAVLAPPVIVWASTHATWRGAFVITGILGALWVAAWLFFFRDPAESKLVSEEERRDVLTGRGDSATDPPWSWKRLFSLKQVWGLLAMRFLFDPVFYFYMFWIPQYLSQERGASLEDIGNLTWIPFLVLGISSIIGGAASDRLVRRGWSINRARKLIMTAAALFTPISVLSLIAPDAFWAIILLAGLMFAHGFWMTNYMTLFGDLFPSGSVATVVGLSGTAGGIGGALSGLLIGRIVESVSFTPPILACGVVYPLALVILFLTIPRIERLS